MEITPVKETKKPKKILMLFFGFLAVLAIFFGLQWLLKNPPQEITRPETIIPVFKKIEIDFSILENQAFKELEPFEEIEPFSDKSGRENPFLSY